MGFNASFARSLCFNLLAFATTLLGETVFKLNGAKTMSETEGTPLPTENKVASQVDQALSSGESLAEKAVDQAAESAEPAFRFPVLKQLFEFLVHWLLSVASATGQVFITFGITRAQGNAENESLVSAEKAVQAAIQSGDQDAITKAESAFQSAQSAASNSDGSATPR